MNLTAASSSAIVVPFSPNQPSSEPRSSTWTNLTVALAYASAGLPVFPCLPNKLPAITGNWLANATTDKQKISAWWAANPNALVGLPLKPLDAFVLDADRHGDGEDGVAHLEELFATHGPFNGVPEVETANNGRHFYFKQPANGK
jgi:hypothetical protein